MKKFSTIAAAAALAMATAGGVAAETKKIETDPFASTQGMGIGLAVAGGLTVAIMIVAADDT